MRLPGCASSWPSRDDRTCAWFSNWLTATSQVADHPPLYTQQEREMTETKSDWWEEFRISAPIVFASLVFASFAALAFWPAEGDLQWKDPLAWGVVGFVDAYLCAVLVLAAMRSDDATFSIRNPRVRRFFPSRSWSLLLVTMMTVALVLAFGRLYQSRPGMFNNSMSPGRALYISFGTLGLNDFGPVCDYARAVAMCEMFSVIMLVSCVLGLLISRLSSFLDQAAIADVPPKQVFQAGSWIDVDVVLEPIVTTLRATRSGNTSSGAVDPMDEALDKVRGKLKAFAAPSKAALLRALFGRWN